MQDYSIFSDSELLQLLCDDDIAAYTEIYHRYKGVLHQHAYNKLRDREEAKDVVQDLYTSLWDNRDTLVIRTNLAGYLYQGVRNRVLNIIAHKHVESRYLLSLEQFIEEGNFITDHRVRERQLAVIIEREVALLPSKMRQIFEMSRNGNLSHRDIASQLSLSEQTVRTQVRNALRILRVKLGIYSLIPLFFLYWPK